MDSITPVDACDFTVFGGTGDLALRKLLPALYLRDRDGQLPDGFRVIGVSRAQVDDDGYRALVAEALREHVVAEDLDAPVVERLLARLHHVTLDVADVAAWHQLHDRLKDGAASDDVIRVFYLAVAPGLFGTICEHLDEAGLVTERSRVVLEKPMGTDLATAQQVNAAVGRVFEESSIFRIDHYLGKESVQNLLVTRFANTFLEPLWNSRLGRPRADHRVRVDRRRRPRLLLRPLRRPARHGAEPPAAAAVPGGHGAADLRRPRDRARREAQGAPGPAADDARAASTATPSPGSTPPGCARARPRRRTPTRWATPAAPRPSSRCATEVQNWRWAGVPFYLRTGKRMPERVSEIVVVFKEPPHAMFPHSEGPTEANRLHIRVQPDEGMRLHMTAKEPGPGGIRLRPVSLDLSYAAAFGGRSPDAYERLLMDVVRGNTTLFMRRDEVEAAWTWVAPILERWSQPSHRPRTYPAGTHGPVAAVTLLERDGRSWQETE